MENPTEQHFQEPVKLTVTEEVRSYIYETTKWTKFLSIVGFVFTGLIVLGAFTMASVMSALSRMSPGSEALAQMGGTFMTVFMLFYALLVFYPSLLLYKYSTSGQKGILYGDQEAFVTSTVKMKSFFKFYGILLIVVIALYIIMFVSMLALGAGMGS